MNNTISLDDSIAIIFPIAFPAIVNEEIKAVNSADIIAKFVKLRLVANRYIIPLPIAPEIIPHISPITSLQKLDTFSAFLQRNTA